MQRNLKVKDKGLRIKDTNRRIGIVVAEFNADITEKLFVGAQKELLRAGIPQKNISVVRVPGSFELPLACQKMAKTRKYNGLIALGCVIKGETDHYYYIAREAARGIMEVMLAHDIPIGFGVLTTDTVTQAQERVAGKNNKGAEAARAVLRMLSEFTTVRLSS